MWLNKLNNVSYSGAGSVFETRSRFNSRTGAIGSEVTCGVLLSNVRLLDESLVRSLRLQTTGGLTWVSSNSLSLNAVPSRVGPSVLTDRSSLEIKIYFLFIFIILIIIEICNNILYTTYNTSLYEIAVIMTNIL